MKVYFPGPSVSGRIGKGLYFPAYDITMTTGGNEVSKEVGEAMIASGLATLLDDIKINEDEDKNIEPEPSDETSGIHQIINLLTGGGRAS